MSQQNERCIVVAGVVENIDKELLLKKKRVERGKPMVSWLDAILPRTVAATSRKIEVQKARLPFRPFFKEVAATLGANELPLSYQAQLVAAYQANSGDKHSLATYVWRIESSRNRRTFQP